jgi:pimeloyl-ACP methyl ester carboxylesterase
MKRVSIGDMELAVVDRGQGVPLLLVHGFPLDHSMWSGQIEGLSDSCRVIAPDLRGFGQSDVTDGTVTMAQLADDLAALLDGLDVNEPVIFCGLSMGGYVGWEFFIRHRDRLRGLVLCDTRAICDTPEGAQGRRDGAAKVLAEGPQVLVDGMIPKLFGRATVANRPELVEQTRQVMMNTPPQGVAAAARGMAQRIDATSLLPKIDCPTLVVVGEEDAISTVDEMRGFAAAIANAQIVEIAGVGHMSPLEDPAAVNKAIREFVQSYPTSVQ